jgi:hypothetical protein
MSSIRSIAFGVSALCAALTVTAAASSAGNAVKLNWHLQTGETNVIRAM